MKAGQLNTLGLFALLLAAAACGASIESPGGAGGSSPGGGAGGQGGGPAGERDGGDGGAPRPDVKVVHEQPQPPWEQVIDVGRLHQIKITIAASDVPGLETLKGDDVQADVDFDGMVLKSVGIHQKGSLVSGCRCLQLPCKNPMCTTTYADKVKPGLKLAFGGFISGQRLKGLKKLILNNAHQDLSFLSAHIIYELFRRAKLVAPHTAFAQVTINGIPLGLYNIEEDTDPQMMQQGFGLDNDQGNLYEGTLVDFVASPLGPGIGTAVPGELGLHDEQKEARSRDDVVALSAVILGATDANFETEVSKLLDLDRFITARAIEAVAPAFDDYAHNDNNYYLYDNPDPRDNRIVYIPHGIDSALAVKYNLQERVDMNACLVDADCEARSAGAICVDPPSIAGATKYCISGAIRYYPTATPFSTPPGVYTNVQVEAGWLAIAVQDIPSLAAKYAQAVAKVSNPPLWDPDPVKGWMLARINQAADVLKMAKSDKARMDDDLLQFQLNRPVVEAYIKSYGNSRTPRPTGPPQPAPLPNRVPVIVSSDLFYPAAATTIDDYFDLAALYSMPEVDVQALILDNALAGEEQPQMARFSGATVVGRPGARAMVQLETVTRRRTPMAVGLEGRLTSAGDKADGGAKVFQGAVELILSTLKRAPDDSVTLVTLGSLRDVAAAYNRDRDGEGLFKRKVHRVLVFAGDAAVNPAANVKDYNVELDNSAYAAIMSSDLPIFWVPRAHTGAAAGPSNHGSLWSAPLADTLAPMAAGDCPRMDEPNGYCLPIAFLLNPLASKAVPPGKQHDILMWALLYPTYQLPWQSQIMDKAKGLAQNLSASAALATIADRTVAYDGTNPPALVRADWAAPPPNALFGFSDVDVTVSDRGYVTSYAKSSSSHRLKRFDRLVAQTRYAAGMSLMTGKMIARLDVPGH